MTVVTLFLTSLAIQGAKPSDLRIVDVKPAGLSVSVPKSWGQNAKDGTLSASLRVPIPGSKLFGKMDIGFVNDDSKDVDGFLDASKSVLTVGGNSIQRQWKVDIMTSPLALTRFSKGEVTTVRGVLFRPIRSKFMISISGPTAVFDQVEPFLLSTLESMKEIKVIQPKQAAVATERIIHISKPAGTPEKRLPFSHQVQINGKPFNIHLPTGVKVTTINENTISCSVDGLKSPVVVTAYTAEGNPPSAIFQAKAAETSKLFKGAVQRIDQTSNKHGDKQVRDFIWRNGFSEKSGAPLMTADCVTTQSLPMFLYSSYGFEGVSQAANDRKILTNFLTTIRLTEK